jgi:group I intron endonuclease
MVGFIYKIANDFNDKVYIGYTNNAVRRKVEHFSPCQFKRKTKLYNAIRKYGIERFYFEVLYCSEDEHSCLSIMEQYFIKEYNSYNEGYNSTLGGDKQIFTDEIKKKISNSKMGHSVSVETRQKLREKNLRTWKVIYSNGKEILVNDLQAFCDEIKITRRQLQRKHCKKANIIDLIKI